MRFSLKPITEITHSGGLSSCKVLGAFSSKIDTSGIEPSPTVACANDNADVQCPFISLAEDEVKAGDGFGCDCPSLIVSTDSVDALVAEGGGGPGG